MGGKRQIKVKAQGDPPGASAVTHPLCQLGSFPSVEWPSVSPVGSENQPFARPTRPDVAKGTCSPNGTDARRTVAAKSHVSPPPIYAHHVTVRRSRSSSRIDSRCNRALRNLMSRRSSRDQWAYTNSPSVEDPRIEKISPISDEGYISGRAADASSIDGDVGRSVVRNTKTHIPSGMISATGKRPSPHGVRIQLSRHARKSAMEEGPSRGVMGKPTRGGGRI